MTSAYYELIEGLLHPTEMSVGPWTPDVQHGAAVCGAVTRAIEAVPTAQPMDIVRQSTDLSCGVPMGPTRVETRVLREGKRLQVVEADIVVSDEIYARSHVLRMRCAATVDDAIVPRRGRGRVRWAEDLRWTRIPSCGEARWPCRCNRCGSDGSLDAARCGSG